MTISGWIGVDLDGTLAYYDGWKSIDHIGDPIPLMVQRVKEWISQGVEVRIFTARVSGFSRDSSDDVKQQEAIIEDWCEKHIGKRLKVTCQKDFAMAELWDDRCIRVKFNTGEVI